MVVIGIIAAITVPVVMANHRKTETASKLKKFYSTMSNALDLYYIENKTPFFGNNPGIPACYDNIQHEFESLKLNITKMEDDCNDDPVNAQLKYYLSDGTSVIFVSAVNDGSFVNLCYANGDVAPQTHIWSYDCF